MKEKIKKLSKKKNCNFLAQLLLALASQSYFCFIDIIVSLTINLIIDEVVLIKKKLLVFWRVFVINSDEALKVLNY